MHRNVPRELLEISFYDAEQRYLRSLPLEHFMEAFPQGTQRRITLTSLDLVHVQRPDIQYFNEMLTPFSFAFLLGMVPITIAQAVPDPTCVPAETSNEIDRLLAERWRNEGIQPATQTER